MNLEIHCKYCSEDIRYIDDFWIDRETHATCAKANGDRIHEPLEQSEDNQAVAVITNIIREADSIFEKVGGSSRHWVRDCLLPLLHKHDLIIVSAKPTGEKM